VIAQWRVALKPVMIIVRRELRDTLRDWRIVIPIILLTLAFPMLMNFTAQYLRNYLQRFGEVNSIIGDRLIPFLLLIVGFFPVSFSLVIALETFVGEKERKSLESLLATPLSDVQLYFGKMLGAMLPPLMASYMGMTLYLVGLYGSIRWVASPELLVLIFVLTTVQALVMVCGAVVVSTQVTSVRASNLLASFIIIPMALLIQAESGLMFWADYRPLWFVSGALVVVALILARMGIALFNREELLGREIDELNLPWLARSVTRNWFENVPRQRMLNPLVWYRYSVGATLRRLRLPSVVVVIVIVAGFVVGYQYASIWRLPPLTFDKLSETLPGVFQAAGPGIFFMQNLRTLVLGGLLGIFSFGSLSLVVLMAPFAIIGYATGQLALSGYSPVLVVLALVAPHGVAEIPAAVLAGAAALRLGATVIAPPPGKRLGDIWMQAFTDFVKIVVAVTVPLLVVAALLEVYVTPRVALALFSQ
jgi:uncharacterized membrane protein SpoIIM required for sporulation/ABC-type transport system involved in multi-copper enzyme maturation permease subunit